MKVTDGFGFPAWGPTATHQYDGMVWDSATERLIVGGDAQSNVTNGAAVGSPAEIEHNLWFMDPYAPTPQGAWSKTTYATGPATFGADNGGVYALVDNPDGTYSFRTRGGVRTVSPATRRVTTGSAGPGPIRDNYLFWRTCFRDASSNRYFELHVPSIGAANAAKTAAIYQCTIAGYSKVADLPSSYVENADYLDGNGGVVARSGVAYIWNATSTVWRIDLTSGQAQVYSDATAIPSPGSNNGVWGRWAFVPECGCFVGISSHTGDVQVFRPPSSWQVA